MFGLLIFFGIIEGAITSWLVSQYNRQNNYPNNSFRDRLKFGVFTSWWTVALGAVYLGLFLSGVGGVVSSVASHGAWLFLTWLFWLATAASITAMLGGGRRCGVDGFTYCNQVVAAEAFAWIEWILISVMLIFVILLGFRSIRRGDRMSGPITA